MKKELPPLTDAFIRAGMNHWLTPPTEHEPASAARAKLLAGVFALLYMAGVIALFVEESLIASVGGN
jgi:hypothetical protein